MGSENREFVLEVIKKYRERPCLWQLTNVHYHDRVKRNEAVDELLDLFRLVDPNASRETVQKKLSSMRSCFNKEQRKIKASLASGTKGVHVPKLWYFDHLKFLTDEDTPRISTITSLSDDIQFKEIKEEQDDPDIEVYDVGSETSQSSSVSTVPSKSKSFKRPHQEADQVSVKMAKRIDQAYPALTKPHDAFGLYVAEKMRSLPSSMVPFCQKMINDAIFLAEIGELNVTSTIVTSK